MKTKPQSGFSLIEILVTLSIIALLMTVAVPQFQTLVEKNKVQALMDEFTSSLYMTRGEAAKRGYQVTLCASNAAKTGCDTTATNFASGWIIFVDYDGDGVLGAPTLLFDVNGNGTRDTAESILYVSSISAGDSSTYVIQSSGTGVRSRQLSYRADGLPTFPDGTTTNAGFSVVKSGESNRLARININRTGRIYSKIASGH